MTADWRGHDSWMAWFLRAIELADGRWACRRGGHEYDAHESLEHSLGHLSLIAGELGSTKLFAHHLDGRVTPHGGRPAPPSEWGATEAGD
ncbi:hypothetical protein ASG88_22025 [Nocardioides sp. Soil777]|nr:hypothetical protein ASG88_22025 [Nocardioides sp. Soil777]